MSEKIRLTFLPSRAEKDSPRRIVEQRGEMAILHPVGPVYNPVYFDLHPGEGNIRGRHYHKSKTEMFYVISGHCRISYFDLETGAKGSLEMRQGDMATVLPNCAHQLEAVEFCQVIEFSTDDVDYSEDTMPYEL
ncbi:MAG: cupin domain-containing protein [Desulfomonile tiedjei]|nr:cupin domain-containing protein [Desulfomonile tiedjei]